MSNEMPQAAGATARLASDKVMFEVYRDADRGEVRALAYRVVYYTELDEKSKEREIARALAGTSVYDGYLGGGPGKADAQRVLARFIEALNGGAVLDVDALERALAPYLV